MSEPVMTRDLIERLSRDFYIQREVCGKCRFNDDSVRIDLLFKAKQHLIDSGFIDEWFGVECKWVEGLGGQTSKITRMVWQSITYAQSDFDVLGQKVRPAFVAVYTPPNLDSSIEKHLSNMLKLGLYGNVGRLHFYRDGTWCIRFANIYANERIDGDFSINGKMLPKRRVGSV